ncbi:MAG: hypothetical protein RL653_3305 [Pseudomonadota bacterium]|jgi:hypothetical protein
MQMPSRFLAASVFILCLAQAEADSTKRMNESSEDAFAELDRTLTLRFTDALTGKPVPDAVVLFAESEGRTDADGAVQFPMPGELGPGEKELEATFRKSGYVATRVKLRFMAGTIFANRFSVTPTLPPGRVRIVLDWEGTPRDLDAHLVKEGAWHISFRNLQQFEDLAFLDRDDRDGHGPETITVARLDPRGTFRYFVHDFTNAGSRTGSGLANGRARVRLYTEAGLLDAFDVPASLVGDRWEVFSIVNGQVVRPGTR